MSDLVMEIEEAVLATPGVLALYRTGSLVANMVSAAVEQVASDTVPRVVVTERDAQVQVEVAIGIRADVGAADAAQQVRQRLAALLLARDERDVFVRVTVARVFDGADAV